MANFMLASLAWVAWIDVAEVEIVLKLGKIDLSYLKLGLFDTKGSNSFWNVDFK